MLVGSVKTKLKTLLERGVEPQCQVNTATLCSLKNVFIQRILTDTRSKLLSHCVFRQYLFHFFKFDRALNI